MDDNPKPTIGRGEFIALMAFLFATVAFSIDAMLPAMPNIAQDLGLTNPQHAPLILTLFMIGLGAGTFVMGPLSDALGRRAVVFLGLAIYIIGALLAWSAPTLEMMLLARVLQGIGASGPRAASTAIIRDLFSGRDMASIMSLTLMVFLLMPALAPLIGAETMKLIGWRGIFLVFVGFALLLTLWFGLRLGETLPRDRRRPFRPRQLQDAVKEVFAHRTVRLSIAVQTLLMTTLFSVLTMVHPVFDIAFDQGETFPYWFGAIAITSAGSSLLNSRLVVRFGMLRLASTAVMLQILVSSLVLLALCLPMTEKFPIFLMWLFGMFLQAGMTTANLNAIAMQPMGHIAGMASAVIAGVSTCVGAAIASPLALLFDGTARPLVAIVLGLIVLSALLLRLMRKEEAATA